jgi:enamine deaminase RidA (YjgF/YER057c/UK114 family)
MMKERISNLVYVRMYLERSIKTSCLSTTNTLFLGIIRIATSKFSSLRRMLRYNPGLCDQCSGKLDREIGPQKIYNTCGRHQEITNYHNLTFISGQTGRDSEGSPQFPSIMRHTFQLQSHTRNLLANLVRASRELTPEFLARFSLCKRYGSAELVENHLKFFYGVPSFAHRFQVYSPLSLLEGNQ